MINDRELAKLADQKPTDIEQALAMMKHTLTCFHKYNDKRAIFLRLYYIMTLEVYKAIHGCGRYADKRVFLDPAWITRLSGKFATLYFQSLTADTGPKEQRAWKAAYHVARRRRSPVVENALLGINAHINYDLPRAIAQNLRDEDLDDYPTLQVRKFDHDQVNNLLTATLNRIQRKLAKDYEPGVAIADHILGSFDERMSEHLLRHYREHVWGDALAYAAAERDGLEQVVTDNLNWKSYQLAKKVKRAWWLWGAEIALNLLVRGFAKKHWENLRIEDRCHDHRAAAGGRRAA